MYDKGYKHRKSAAGVVGADAVRTLTLGCRATGSTAATIIIIIIIIIMIIMIIIINRRQVWSAQTLCAH